MRLPAMWMMTIVLLAGCAGVASFKERELCTAIEQARPSCECFNTNTMPESVKNQSVVPECFCICFENGEQLNVSVVRSR